MAPAIKKTDHSPEMAEFRSMKLTHGLNVEKLNCPSDDGDVVSQSGEKLPSSTTSLHSLNKVYGRQTAEIELFEAFDRCTRAAEDGVSKAAEVVLITGPSGSGKSFLAESLRRKVEKDGQGFWLAGKFDQLSRPNLSYPLVRAVQGHLLSLSDIQWQHRQEFQSMQIKIAEVADSEPLLVDWIPALRQFQSVSEAAPSSPFNRPEHAKQKSDSKLQHSSDSPRLLALAFCRLMKALCSPEIPLVLFLDDIQWAKTAPLEMLRILVSDPELINQGGLMLLTACRGNEVPMEHHLAVTLREMEAVGICLTDIGLDNLGVPTVKEMLVDHLRKSPKAFDEETQERLALHIWEQSGGNAYFTIQLIQKVVCEGFESSFSNIQHYESNVDIIAERIAGLPQETQRLLMLASCFGAEFHAFLLQELSDSDIHQALSMAEKELLIERIEVTSDVASLGVLQHFQAWRFAHDQIQQSAYSLVDESEREQTHLEIGRRLWNGLSEEHLKLFGFAVVRQIRMGACLIVDGAERLKAADLLLNAGVYASKTSAFDEAATYFELAISLLPPRHWRDEYFLSLRLYERAAQLAYCSGNHERVDDLTDEVFKNARENKHKLVAYISRIRSAATRDHAQEALDLAIKVLNENGFKVSRRSNMASIVYNVMKTKLMLGSRSDLQIRMNSRKQVDEAALHITTIVNIATTTSTVVDPHLFPILAMKGVQRALAEGVHGETAISFAAAALIMCCHIGDVELGLRLAKLALEIIEDTKAVEWQPQVALIVHAFVFPVQQPVANQLGPLLVAHRLGMKYGDIASGMFAGHLLSMFSLHACRPLNQLIENMATYKLIMENYGQTVAVHHLMPTLQTALNLIGNGEQTSSLTGELMDEEYFENVQARDCFSALAMMKGSKLLLSCVFGEYDAALEIARDISNWTDSSFSLVFLSNAYLFSGIIFAAAAKARNQKGVSKVKNVLKLLKKAVRHSGGVYDSQVSILEAEVDALSGKWQSALVKYNQAIERASEEKLHMLTGIAHERVANLLISERLHSESMMHLASATEAFEAWEANAKVKQLSNRIASMRVIPPRG